MIRPRFSEQAQDDLANIWAYIAMDSQAAADRQLQAILDAGQTLVRFTELGEACEELLPSLRRFTVGNYVIYYRPIEQGIEVIRVLGGARDIEGQF